jgi:hypothetical protein
MPTVPEIKERLDELGVAYQPRAKKAELLLLLPDATPGELSPPQAAGRITRARAQAIAREAMMAARDKADELPDEDRDAVTDALDTLERSAEDAMAGGDSVNDVLGDLTESIDLTVQSLDALVGMADDERREALDATLGALDDASALIDVSALDLDPDEASADDAFESAALDFDQSGWSEAEEEDTSSASTALKRGLAQRRTEVVRSESAEDESARLDQQEEANKAAAARRAAKRTEGERREAAANDARDALRARMRSVLQQHAVVPVGESSVGLPGVSSITAASPSLAVSPTRTPTRRDSVSSDVPSWGEVSSVSSQTAALVEIDEMLDDIVDDVAAPDRGLFADSSTASSPSVAFNPQTTASQLGDIDDLLAEVMDDVAAALPNASAAELSAALVKEVTLREDMSMVRERLTDPAQAQAFANATRQTPRLLKLITQGVYAPTAFTGTTGKQAAMKIEQQLAYAEGAKTSGARRAAGPIVARERPTAANPDIKRWRRPRFTTAAS